MKSREDKSFCRKARGAEDAGRCAEAYHRLLQGGARSGRAGQRVAFGTSGHRGSSFKSSFNEWHILAITQAICAYRARQGINGPLFLGIDTHALSIPAYATALEVLSANGVEVMLAEGNEYTPTPVISHAILTYNLGRKSGLADGIVITPSHNPPNDGGFKYNPPNGGPADNAVTDWIEAKANALLEARLKGVKRVPYQQALRAPRPIDTTISMRYINDLGRCHRPGGHSRGRAFGSASIRWAAPASIIGRESPSATGLNLTVVTRRSIPPFVS